MEKKEFFFVACPFGNHYDLVQTWSRSKSSIDMKGFFSEVSEIFYTDVRGREDPISCSLLKPCSSYESNMRNILFGEETNKRQCWLVLFLLLFSLVSFFFFGQVIVYLSGDFKHAMFKRCSKRERTILPANIYLFSLSLWRL